MCFVSKSCKTQQHVSEGVDLTDKHSPIPCDVNFSSYKRIRMEFLARDVDGLDNLHGRYLVQVRERVYEKIRVAIYHKYHDKFPPFRAELWDQFQISVIPVLHFAVSQDERKVQE